MLKLDFTKFDTLLGFESYLFPKYKTYLENELFYVIYSVIDIYEIFGELLITLDNIIKED